MLFWSVPREYAISVEKSITGDRLRGAFQNTFIAIIKAQILIREIGCGFTSQVAFYLLLNEYNNILASVPPSISRPESDLHIGHLGSRALPST